jgi:hypothetical protein
MAKRYQGERRKQEFFNLATYGAAVLRQALQQPQGSLSQLDGKHDDVGSGLDDIEQALQQPQGSLSQLDGKGHRMRPLPPDELGVSASPPALLRGGLAVLPQPLSTIPAPPARTTRHTMGIERRMEARIAETLRILAKPCCRSAAQSPTAAATDAKEISIARHHFERMASHKKVCPSSTRLAKG